MVGLGPALLHGPHFLVDGDGPARPPGYCHRRASCPDYRARPVVAAPQAAARPAWSARQHTSRPPTTFRSRDGCRARVRWSPSPLSESARGSPDATRTRSGNRRCLPRRLRSRCAGRRFSACPRPGSDSPRCRCRGCQAATCSHPPKSCHHLRPTRFPENW